MAVFPSRLAYPAKYARDPITVYAAGDTALRYGEFAVTKYGTSWTYRSSRLDIGKQEDVWDDVYGEYVTEYVETYAFIEADVTGFEKLIINAKNYNKYATCQCGWGVAVDTSGEWATPDYSAAADCEFDISGQSVVYIKLHSDDYPLYVYGIRLE